MTTVNTWSSRGYYRRGSSGAKFSEVRRNKRLILKYGNDRVLSQGLWIRDHQSPILPLVAYIDEEREGYAMEKLYNLPWEVIDKPKLMKLMIDKLSTSIWSQPAEIALDADAHLKKVQNLSPSNEIWRMIYDTFYSIDWNNLPKNLTHGDPTFDNVMVRWNGEIVIIDPIPATSAVPDLRCVDIGKMMQTVAGFEAIRYGDSRFKTGVELSSLFGDLEDGEYAASQYWCAVHLLRAIPYMPTREISDILEQRAYTILRYL